MSAAVSCLCPALRSHCDRRRSNWKRLDRRDRLRHRVARMLDHRHAKRQRSACALWGGLPVILGIGTEILAKAKPLESQRPDHLPSSPFATDVSRRKVFLSSCTYRRAFRVYAAGWNFSRSICASMKRVSIGLKMLRILTTRIVK